MNNFSIIIPTIGRPTLARTLQSIVDNGLLDEDEVIVVGDGSVCVDNMVLPCGPQFYYHELKHPTKDSGNTPRELGIANAVGSHLLFIDDDDVYTPAALTTIRKHATKTPDVIHIFKMQFASQNYHFKPGDTLWDRQRVECGNIGSPMICVPNRASRLGEWGSRYQGDFDFLSSTLAKYPDRERALRWHTDVVALIRP